MFSTMFQTFFGANSEVLFAVVCAIKYKLLSCAQTAKDVEGVYVYMMAIAKKAC